MLSGSAVRGGEAQGTLEGQDLILRCCAVPARPKVCITHYIWILMTVFRVSRRYDRIHTFEIWRCGGSFHSNTHAEARHWWYVIEPVAQRRTINA